MYFVFFAISNETVFFFSRDICIYFFNSNFVMIQRSNDKLQDALVNLAKSVKSLVGQIRKNCSNAAQQLSPKTPPPPKSPKAAAGKGEAAK